MVSNKSTGQPITNGNDTQALLDDLKERGYELSVGENGRLRTNPNGPPMTPVIWHALQANYGKLVRLLKPPVTDTNSLAVETIEKDNTDWSRVKNLAPKRGEEMERAISEYRQSYQDARAAVTSGDEAPENPFDAMMMVGLEADKRKPGRDREAERRIEASKKGGLCAGCAGEIKEGEKAYLAERVFAGMWGGLTPRPGPRYVGATVCGECAPGYMTKSLESSFDTQIDASGRTARTYYDHNVAQMPCATCERPVVFKRTSRWRPRVYCSYRCEYTYHNRRRSQRDEHLRQKTCEVCSKEFTATRAHAKTCSPACKQTAYRLRKRNTR